MVNVHDSFLYLNIVVISKQSFCISVKIKDQWIKLFYEPWSNITDKLLQVWQRHLRIRRQEIMLANPWIKCLSYTPASIWQYLACLRIKSKLQPQKTFFKTTYGSLTNHKTQFVIVFNTHLPPLSRILEKGLPLQNYQPHPL